MSYKGTVRNGVVVLEPGASLPEGTPVKVEPETWESVFPKAPLGPPEEDPAYRMAERAGPTGIPDLSINADHYLYGHPKVSDGR
jgi:hypothetical protein